MDELIIAGLAGLMAGGSLVYIFWVHPLRVAKGKPATDYKLMSQSWEIEKKFMNTEYESLCKIYRHLFEHSEKMQIALAEKDKTIAELQQRLNDKYAHED